MVNSVKETLIPAELTHTLAASPIYLALDEIRRDGGTQPRAKIDLKHISRLEEQMEEGQELEPVTTFYDGESYWLADGFHRWQAHKNFGEEVIACVVHQGTRRDAVLYSVSANAEHKPALPRSRADKRRAVMTLLNDPEWSQWSDREIARQSKVSNRFVTNLRNSLTVNVHSENTKRTYTTKHGTTAEMKTANIGRNKTLPEPPTPKRVTVTNDHPAYGHSGIITQFPNPYSAIVELDTGERSLINIRSLLWEETKLPITEQEAATELDSKNNQSGGLKYSSLTDQVLPDVPSDQINSLADERPSPPPLQKVEVNTNDICTALISNVDNLTLDQAQAVFAALERRWSIDELTG